MFRARLMLAVAGIAAVLGSSAMAASAPLPCASDDEARGFVLRHLQSKLMVAALSCNQRDAYNTFMQRFMAANPGLIRPEVLRKALYSSYQHRAYDRLAAENDYAGALADTGRALRAGLSPALAAKLVGRCALHALGVRKA